ncbi:MAG: hypothetical protein WC869_00780 [Phycisphaerae bacterium]|jgi:hypothetical protein
MGIHYNRAQARFDKIAQATEGLRQDINVIPRLIERKREQRSLIDQQSEQILQKILALNNARLAAEARVRNFFLNGSPAGVSLADGIKEDEANQAQVKAAHESVAKLMEDNQALKIARDGINEEIEASEAKLAQLLGDPRIVQYNLQANALERKKDAYPVRLKAHLRRCRSFGVADSRIGKAS